MYSCGEHFANYNGLSFEILLLQIDDSFLQFSDEVITQHADGKVSVSGGNKPPVVESLGDVTDFSSSEERAKCESDDSDGRLELTDKNKRYHIIFLGRKRKFQRLPLIFYC